MRLPLSKPLARLLGLGELDRVSVGASLLALSISAITGIVAGLTLAKVKGTLEDLPGLLQLIPAAIALRGNVFGALGNRLSTSIHTGTFVLSRRLGTVVGQNIAASVVLSLVASLIVALLAKAVAVVFTIPNTMSIVEYLVISLLGGVVASALVLAVTIALTAGSVRFDWDLDNVTAPLVTAAGDLFTIPALVLAAQFVGRGALTPVLAALLVVLAVASMIWAWRSRLQVLTRIIQESLPILSFAALLSLIAGIVVEKRLATFVEFGALLVLLPGYLGTSGALGGILSSRLSSKLHLGLVEPSALPERQARLDIRLIFTIAVPIFLLNGIVAQLGALLGSETSPGVVSLLAIAVLGGLLATVFVSAVGYYGTIVAVRFGLDPDNYGIPLVTSSLDVVGAFTLIIAIVLVGGLG